jgi:hypothetical protein
MTHTYEDFSDDQLMVLGTRVAPGKADGTWFRAGSSVLTIAAVAAIWFYKIAPDDKTPNTMMVEPATELLSSFVQPAPDVTWLSKDLGFKVDVPDLKRLGVESKTVGEAEFGGQHAAVMQYQGRSTDFLLYSFSGSTKLIDQMRYVASGDRQFYVTSGGEVSVVVWKDRCSGYHALAAKLTEQDLLALAANVAVLA